MQRLCKVKTEEQIKNTLNENGYCSNVAMASAMYRHCGKAYVARPLHREGIWRLYDKKNRPLGSDFGWGWTWVTEWLDFDSAADENDLTTIIKGGCEK